MAAKIWTLCNVLRGDGISYNQYISELTYLLFLKIAEENGSEATLPSGYRWADLVSYNGSNLLGHYQEMLTHLGSSAESGMVREIYAFPTTVFSHSENLRVVLDGLNAIKWHQISQDGLGQIYEALLAKNSEDARSGAGQYFTPRALVDTIVAVVKPRLGEVIQDPASGTGGFLISADGYLRHSVSPEGYNASPPRYEGMEIERGTYRLCLMNVFLHNMVASVSLGDALTQDSAVLSPADLILANPPFGSKFASARAKRPNFSFVTANKQLEFLQHIYRGLKPGGRAAVILPDNVLFEEGIGRQVRQELMDLCSLHTILRLPTGIFYAQGVKTNVLFFTRGHSDKGQTKETWIYDLRSGAPKFGKRTALTIKYFTDFIDRFGDWPTDSVPRPLDIQSDRFRRFSREEFSANGDNLDVRWLMEDEGSDELQLLRPEEISALILSELRAAIAEVEELHAQFDSSIGQ
ncbi:MAG: SAM-dependent methyltransferase [Mesorhizobium sp.]|nr:MAG: SAM-dependent methyltransferase [Mesorhizobium sp.]RWC37999.1 MAG: SAM-dependent methyltransferase [Mesorhizobium sp.]